MVYANGKGVEQSDEEAVKWFKIAADNGLPEAQYSLGKMYLCGKGIGHSKREAVRWFIIAADHGNVDAEKALREMGL